jgi:predicted nucleic acid-binding protein
MRFVDTNVLLYAVSTARDEQKKSRVARSILDEEDLALSVQVLQEFYVQSTRPSRQDPMTHEQATLLIESFLRFPIQETTLGLMQAALSAKERFQISHWEAAIIEAARMLGCHTVVSEDLNDQQNYDGVIVNNPFL